MPNSQLQQNNVAHWDRVARQIGTSPWGKLGMKLWQEFLPRILKAFPFNKDTTKVLDHGSGTGYNASTLVPHAKSILGIDISPGLVTEFNENMERWGLASDGKISAIHVPNLEEDGLAGKKFDVITSCMVYHHLPSAAATSKVLASLLKPGGVLMIIDWVTLPQPAEHQKEINKIMNASCHGFQQKDMHNIIVEAGLEFVGFGPLVKIDEVVEDHHPNSTAFLATARKSL